MIDIPKMKPPQPIMIGNELAKSLERWRNAMAPLTAIGELVRKQIDIVAPLRERLIWLEEQEKQYRQMEQVGWLPHGSSPIHLTKTEGFKGIELHQRITEFYDSNWDGISTSLRATVQACDLDQEARDCFSEALSAHGASLYRCAPRLLFPEIERVARNEVHGGSLDKTASQDRLVAKIGGLTPAELSSTGVTGLRFYKVLTEHLYQPLKDTARVAGAVADPIPNRHAVVHGLVSYTSAQSSINAILVADYLLQAISTIKRLAREDAEA